MVLVTVVSSRKRMGAAAYSIFLFQKSRRFLAVMPLHEIIIDTERAMLKSASPSDPVVYLVLGDEVLFFYFHMVRYGESFLF